MASPSPKLFSPQNKRECQDDVRLLQQERVIALDSEGVQLGKDGPLTLLQIGTLDGRVYLFDVMRNEREQDRTFFRETGLDSILTSTEIVKVIQSCSGDSAALYHQFDIKLENVFDTQVAHLVIQENKGRRHPSRVKLAEICRLYSKDAAVYEGKEDVQMQWNKHVGNFWAKRPMTKEMIEYASGDVTALIPEVYETQKGYIEENGLTDLFAERVHEEIEYEIDPKGKEHRKDRNLAITKQIIQDMASKYRRRTDFTSITDEDEIKALNEIKNKELSDLPDVIKDLKLQSMESFLKTVEKELEEPEAFNPDRGYLFKLNDIEHCGSEPLQNYAIRIKRRVVEIVTSDIQKKYTADTPLENLSTPEYQIIRGLKPLSDDEPQYHPTVEALHWKIAAHEIKEGTEKLDTDPDYNLTIPIPKLKFFTNNPKVPTAVKRLAETLLQKNESRILKGIERKYTRDTDTPLENLSTPEYQIIRGLKPLSDDEPQYHPTVEALHWKIAAHEIKEGTEKLDTDPDYNLTIPIPKLKFFTNNPKVPAAVKRLAETLLQKNESRILKGIERKYTRDTRTNQMSDAEKMVLEKLKLSSNNYHPIVESLHWKIAYEKLCTDHENYRNRMFTINDGFRRKLDFFRNDKKVPDNIKQKAVEVLRELPQRSRANRGRSRRY